MSATLTPSLDALRAALLKLDPTGPDGFEGLLAILLSKIAGQPFRLASSGLQLGKDGETLTDTNHIAFEAKLYTDKGNKADVLSKMTWIIGGAVLPDLWVLCATIEANTQLLEPLQRAAQRNGISTLVLDWPASTIPPLATACAMASEETVAFLSAQLSDRTAVRKAKAALKAIRAATDFDVGAAALLHKLTGPALGMPVARDANRRWLAAAFGDRALSKMLFGQVLAPGAQALLPLRPRDALIASLRGHLSAAPEGKIVVVLGGDGCGKSWLFAQSWLYLEEPLFTVVIPANEFKPGAAHGSIEALLITKFIEQSNGSLTEETRRKWESRLARWSGSLNVVSPRFVVFIDGLNQQWDFDWASWLGGAANKIGKLGGTLVVTVREAYFNDRIRTAVASNIEAIRVPEWTAAELTEILSERGISSTTIETRVLERLRNPRILAIAFDLYGAGAVRDFSEFSVERLLFEHIRIGASDGSALEPVDQFRRRLAEHAQQIIDRIKAQQHDDRLVFESTWGQGGQHELSTDLLAVTAGHFFHPLGEDPTRYTLTEEGLSLALGLSIIKALQKAQRNDHDVADALEELLEPIAALDKTAEAVFSALLAASIDTKCYPEIYAALICGYLRLQNIPSGTYAPFAASVRGNVTTALRALETISVASRYSPNKNWLIEALRACRADPAHWAIIADHMARWLRTYSLSPELGVMSRRSDAPEKFAREVEEQRERLERRCEALPAEEKSFLREQMMRSDIDPAPLHSGVFELLSGMELAGFVPAFVAWAFSQSLNRSFNCPDDEFMALIRFNRRDWIKTREEVLKATSFLQQDSASTTAKWALVTLLRAFSTLDDAERETRLVDELTADREKFSGWRLVERYCATDPCDPLSKEPDNIEDTAQKYAAIEIVRVGAQPSMGSEDHFFRDALPGLARFRPKVAIMVQRRYAAAVIERRGWPRMIGVTSLVPASAVLDDGLVGKLLKLGHDLSAPYRRESRESRDDWIASQHALLAAFPHLGGDMQIETLEALPPHGPLLLKLTEAMKPGASARLEQLLQRAMASGDEHKKLAAIAFARHSRTDVSETARALVRRLAFDDYSAVRSEAIGLIADLGDAPLTKAVVESGWSAAQLNPREDAFQVWHGSRLLIFAAKAGLIDTDEALARIAPALFSLASSELGRRADATIADLLKTAVGKALEIDIPFRPPRVEQRVDKGVTGYPSLLSLADDGEDLSPDAAFNRFGETTEEFDRRQREGWESFKRFDNILTRENARLIIEDVGLRAIEACVSLSPQWGCNLARVMLAAPDSKIMHAENFALMLARSLSGHDPELSRALFARVSGMRGFVSLTYGPSGVSLEAISAWGGAVNDAWDELRAQRLDRAENDEALTQEVMAALIEGRAEFLREYARARLQCPEPASVARGLMVLGLGQECPLATEQLAKYADAQGFIGQAAQAARYAYERDRWARHWYRLMADAESGEEFWRLSAIFLKIVDARYELWQADDHPEGSQAALYETGLRSEIARRIKAWGTKRAKVLFGEKAPERHFLTDE